MTDLGGHPDDETIEIAIRAGAAVFNAGHYHAAHDAWEDYWLELESGTDDERFLHGMIQFTAAAHHAGNDNREGATGLAESALEYLDGLGRTYRGVDLAPVRRYLRGLHTTPDVGRDPVPTLTVDSGAVTPDRLSPAALSLAALTVAEDAALDETPSSRSSRSGNRPATRRSEARSGH